MILNKSMNSESFDPNTFILEKVVELANVEGEVLALLSGGVDSITSASLLKEAGVRMRLLHVITGFQRENETQEVVQSLSDIGFSIEAVDRSDYFLSGIGGLSKPHQKRAAFRELYFELLMDLMEGYSIRSLLHGTQQYVTSGRPGHNNPTIAFLKRDYNIIEPVRGLSKPQVRAIAKELRLPPSIIFRRPFPGPALLLRFGGKYSQEKLGMIRSATKIVDDFVRDNSEVFQNCYQIFPYLGNGSQVMALDASGEAMQGYPLYIRAVQRVNGNSDNEMAVFQLASEVQTQLVDALMSIDGIARILWDVTPKREKSDAIGSAGIEYI